MFSHLDAELETTDVENSEVPKSLPVDFRKSGHF